MATTAVVNPRRRRRRKARRANPRRRRYRYGAARRRRNPSPYAMANPRRRRRGRRRRYSNPSPYAMVNPRRRSRGGRRRNPTGDLLDFDRVIDQAPAATLGVLAARWLIKFAGPFEGPAAGVAAGGTGVAAPGVKHALAIMIGSKIAGDMIDGFMPGKGHLAEISALGFGGDLFLRKRFMANSPWMANNLYMDGFEMDSQIGQDTFTDATGQQYVRTPSGWALAGMGQSNVMVLPNGDVVQLEGFEMQSQIGDEYEDGAYAMGSQYTDGGAAMGSSFGYG